jgi:hypothetical protein
LLKDGQNKRPSGRLFLRRTDGTSDRLKMLVVKNNATIYIVVKGLKGKVTYIYMKARK